VLLDLVVGHVHLFRGAGDAQVVTGAEAVAAVQPLPHAVGEPELHRLAHAPGGDVGLGCLVLVAFAERVGFSIGVVALLEAADVLHRMVLVVRPWPGCWWCGDRAFFTSTRVFRGRSRWPLAGAADVAASAAACCCACSRTPAPIPG